MEEDGFDSCELFRVLEVLEEELTEWSSSLVGVVAVVALETGDFNADVVCWGVGLDLRRESSSAYLMPSSLQMCLMEWKSVEEKSTFSSRIWWSGSSTRRGL